MENAREYYEIFSELRRKSSGRDVSHTFEMGVGHPAEQIVFFAEAKKIDHIVTGHRGKTLFQL